MLDNLKSFLLNHFISLKSSLEDSEFFQKIVRIYNELPERGQKASVGGVIALGLFILIWPSISFLSSSSDSVDAFRNNQKLISDLFKIQNMSSLSSGQSLNFQGFQTRLKRVFEKNGVSDEQTFGVELIQSPALKSTSKKKVKAKKPNPSYFEKESFQVGVKDLTLKQAVSLGSDMQNLSPLIRLMGITFTKSKDKEGYITANYLMESYLISKVKKKPVSNSKKSKRKSRSRR